MSGFSGSHKMAVDEKGRMMLPAPFRDVIAKTNCTVLSVTNAAFDECLEIYTFEEWEKLEERVKAMPRFNKAVKYLKRRVMGSAHPVELDKQGRVLLPLQLRQKLGIAGEAIVVGMIDKIEVWNAGTWDKVNTPESVDAESYGDILTELGLH